MTITKFEQLEKFIKLTPEEKGWKEGEFTVPLKITSHYVKLINPQDPEDPLRKQVVPNIRENIFIADESPDPLAEESHSPNSVLIHRYANRVAFLATDICPMYCRHCFRRRWTGNMKGPATEEEIRESAQYLAKNPQIKEMLITGGDPLTLSDSQLDRIITVFRKALPQLVIRLCSRYPISEPSRINLDLIHMLKKHNTAPFYFMTQFNHPREITEESIRAVSLLTDNGIGVFNQTVLLKGVNDNADVLEELCNKLVFNRVKPYYLFQGDLVSGTAAFRVPVSRGMEIEKELRKRLSGLAMPLYAADLPQGGGKIPLCGSYIESIDKNYVTFKNLDGQLRRYPSE